ncbi:MAG: helix-turn-helix domain-containing protein [Cetobacterium sp.]|uniref:helix-turn-helix domain-containing protein n=2 Tax=Cetobacterium sp. TaxID=2071632 RepID=UPI003F3BEAA6
MFTSSKHIQAVLVIKKTKIEDYKVIAKLLNIKPLSLFFYIQEIEKIFWGKNEFDIKTIIKKIKDSKEILPLLRKHQKITKPERKLYISFVLLDKRVINITQLSELLEVTRRTLSYDLEEIKRFLNFYNLKLVPHKNQGLRLEGVEKNIRRMLLGYIFKIFIERKFLPELINSYFMNFLKENNLKNILLKVNSIPKDKKNYIYYNDISLISSILAFTTNAESLPKNEFYITSEISFLIPTCAHPYLSDIANNRYYTPTNFLPKLKLYKTFFESTVNKFFKIEIDASFYQNLPIEKWLVFFVFKEIFEVNDLYYTNILTKNIPQNISSLIKKLQKQIPFITVYDGIVIYCFILDYIYKSKENYKNIFVYSNIPIPLTEVAIKRIEYIYNIKFDQVLHTKEFHALFKGNASIKYNVFSFENIDLNYKNITFKKISLSKFFNSEN